MAIENGDLDSALVKDNVTGKSLMGVAILAGEITLTAGDITVESDVTIIDGTVHVEPGVAPLVAEIEPGANPIHTIVDSGALEATIPSRDTDTPLGLVKIESGPVTVQPGTLPIHTIVDSGAITVSGTVTIQEPLDVDIQDATNDLVSSHAVQILGTSTFDVDAIIGSYTCTLSAGHGFVNGVDGQMLLVDGLYSGEVLSVATNVLTLNYPFDRTYAAGTAVIRANEYMNVNGSVTPAVFIIKPEAGIKYHITGFHLAIISTTAMDDSLFGGLAALSRGLVCRVRKSAVLYNNLFVAKTNGDMALFGEVAYSTKAPAGKYGLVFSLRFKDHYGVVIELDGDLAEELQFIIRDDLRASGEIECIIHGHVVEDPIA